MQPNDRGYFPSGESMLRRVNGTRAVGSLYGQRALLMQATHPLAFAGLIANTDGLDAPFRRLARTAKAMETVFFGSRAEADAVTARVRRMHSRVRGTIDQPAGRYPAGSAYDANSPEFLLWILACIADSGLAVYEQLVCRLSDEQREHYWSDYVRLGEMFGLDPADAPADYTEFRAYIDDRLHSDDLFVIEDAQTIARQVAFDMPLPANRAPAMKLLNFLTLGLLPKRVRELYALQWDLGRQVAYEALCASLRTGARVTPAALRRGPSAEAYELVARTERERQAKQAAA